MNTSLREKDMIVTAGEKRGVMPRAYYERLMTFIIETLEAQETVPFFALLEQAEQNFSREFRGELAWYLLYVKQDMEARRLIKVMRDKKRQQWIRLKKKYKERLSALRLDQALN